MGEKYDPDRMSADDIDWDDPEAVMDYLDHPTTVALFDDLGRSFRQSPAAQQRAELERYIDEQTMRLAEVQRLLEDQRSDEVRAAFVLMRDTLTSNITSAR